MMVKLDRIYTRGGDNGKTSVVGGGRLKKDSARIEAIGDVDETNAAIGLARTLTMISARIHAGEKADDMLGRIQDDLFDLGADLANPDMEAEGALRIVDAQVTRLENEIDALNENLSPLTSFILPGGSEASAALHMVRTVCRRAERRIVSLGETEAINPAALKYINRLSDHLFVLARHLNEDGEVEILWRPGANR